MKKQIFFRILIIIIILTSGNVWAHDNLQVHPKITYRALDNKIIPNITDKYPELETYRGAKTVYQSGDAQYYNSIIEGTYGEDVPATRGRFHFFHYGNSGVGLFGCSSAYETAKDFWKWAFECYDYTTTGKEQAYYSSGRAAHLLQDMLVPAHVQNDMHLPFTGPDDYEEYVRIPAVVGKIQGYGTSPKQESSLEEYHKRLAEKTYTASSFQADFNYLRLGRPSASGELKEMFGDKLKYVFSGSSGTSGKLYWRIAGVGNYYPILLSSYTSDWWECTDAGASSQWDNYYYLENIDQANPYKIRNDLFSTYGPSNPTIPNTIGGLCKIYMEKKNNGVSLIDVAINYSAGLLKYYHDAVNHPPYLKSAKIKGPGGKKYEGVWVDDEEERITPYSILANKYKKVMERFLNKSGGEKKKDKDPAKYTGWTDDGMMDDSKPLWCGTNFELILNFSEKVSKPTIEIELPAGASKNVSINVGASYQEIWTGEINFDEPDYLKKLSWESKWAYLEAALLFENLQRLVI